MNKKFVGIIVLALVLRLALVFVAHHGDLNNNISWGTLAVERGLNNFYEGKNWPFSNPNQPPLTILTFAGTRLAWQQFANVFQGTSLIWWWQDKGADLLVKLPGILADLAIGWLIYRLTKRKALLAVWLFNPITWYNSAIWGQTDSLVNLLFFAGIFFLLQRHLACAAIFFVLSLLFKGSLAFFYPLVFAYAIFQKYSFKKWLLAIGYSLLVISLISVWFHPKFDLFVWLFNLYKQRIFPGEIGYLTANAFNFWWLVDPGQVLDSTLFFGLSARAWGVFAAGLGLGWCLFWLKKKPTEKKFFLSLCILSLIIFLFMTRIHERYLYPFFLPATILLGTVPGMAIPYLVLSMTHLFNLYNFFWAPGIPILINLYQYPQFPIVLSLVNIVVFVYTLRLLKVKS